MCWWFYCCKKSTRSSTIEQKLNVSSELPPLTQLQRDSFVVNPMREPQPAVEVIIGGDLLADHAQNPQYDSIYPPERGIFPETT